MKKKLALILISLCLALPLTGCQAKAAIEDPPKSSGGAWGADRGDPAEPGGPASPAKATVEEQVLVDQDGIVITLLSLSEGGMFGPELKFLVENNGKVNVHVRIGDTVVNGAMVHASMYGEVAPGKKSNITASIDDVYLERAGITTIAEIRLALQVVDDSYDTIVETGYLTVQTSAFGSFTQAFDDAGEVVYDRDGVRIVMQGPDESYLGEPAVLFFIENRSREAIHISSKDVSVNDFMINSTVYANVQPNAVAYETLDFSQHELDENGIKEIKTVELYLEIRNEDSYKVIGETDLMTIHW